MLIFDPLLICASRSHQRRLRNGLKHAVAKLDRLNRDLRFISGLMAPKVPLAYRPEHRRRSIHPPNICDTCSYPLAALCWLSILAAAVRFRFQTLRDTFTWNRGQQSLPVPPDILARQCVAFGAGPSAIGALLGLNGDNQIAGQGLAEIARSGTTDDRYLPKRLRRSSGAYLRLRTNRNARHTS